jgi:hypothetical protein
MSIMQKPSALEDASQAAGAIVPVNLAGSTPPSEGDRAAGEPGQTARDVGRRDRERLVRLRRAIDRLRRDGDTGRGDTVPEELAETRLELLLLREENTRLKADRHRPPDLGTLIDYLRLLSGPRAAPETVDDAWSMLAECVAVREALAQACTEADAAVDALERRLRERPRPAKPKGLVSAA